MEPTAVQRRKPRYILGTYWLILAAVGVVGGLAAGKFLVVLVGVAMLGYSVYLYRGGRHGYFIW